MAVGLLPVVGEAGAAEGEHAAGQVGAIHAGQDEKSGVVGHQGEAAAALGGVPAHPLLTVLEVVGGGAPAQQGHPLAIHFGHVAQLFADHHVALEIVMVFHQLAEAFPLHSVFWIEQAELDAFEELLFGRGG